MWFTLCRRESPVQHHWLTDWGLSGPPATEISNANERLMTRLRAWWILNRPGLGRSLGTVGASYRPPCETDLGSG